MKNFSDFLAHFFPFCGVSELFDVVIPVHKKDLETLSFCIKGIRKNIVGARRIIVVSKEKYTNQAEWFDEAKYPFSYAEVSQLVGGRSVGWNYQQLLKLYSSLVIPDILPNVLVVDADTVFYRKVRFFEDGLPLYNLSKDLNLDHAEFHQNALAHIARILPQIKQKFPEIYEQSDRRYHALMNRFNCAHGEKKSRVYGLESGICHHMMFQKDVIKELFAAVEQRDGSGDSFYKIFLRNSHNGHDVTEYNLYFYFLVSHHPQAYKIRLLKYKNTQDFNPLKEKLRRKYHYCSYHSYMRQPSKWREKSASLIDNLFYVSQWNIGVIQAKLPEILQKDFAISWLSEPALSGFYADPFGFEIAGKKFIIFEDYSRILRRGRIAICQLKSDLSLGEKKIILDDKRHLSYPHIFHHEGKIYMVCESYKSHQINLYEIDPHKLEAVKLRTILDKCELVDPTIFFHQNKFWLFCSAEKSDNSQLQIFYTNSLSGEFKSHAKNPVKTDKASSRPAGTMFKIGEEIYRPAQNCVESYGGSLVINRIKTLGENEFSEEIAKEISPRQNASYNAGIHTISALGDLTLVDGRRKIFVPYKPLLYISFKLRKIFGF